MVDMSQGSHYPEISRAKILIVDQYQMVIDGLQSVLESQERFSVVGTATLGADALKIARKKEVDVMITEIDLPDMDGMETTSELVGFMPAIKVLAIPAVLRENDLGRMIAAGVSGFIMKTSTGAELVAAVDALLSGKNYFSPDVKDMVMESLVRLNVPRDQFSLQDLTKREIEVLKLVVKEYTNLEIAEQLFISARTVDAHRRNILHKVGAKNAVGLTKFAISQGLLEE